MGNSVNMDPTFDGLKGYKSNLAIFGLPLFSLESDKDVVSISSFLVYLWKKRVPY